MQGYLPFFGGGGGGLALNQLLVQMDGVDEPPFFRRIFTNKANTWLDAMYFVPQRIGKLSLRLARPKPSPEQVFFIGATNIPLTELDPALTRPGRMGRHVWFRTPTQEDRKDIFDLYMAKVDHDAELDTDRRRDELSRITNGYSPAMIEQVCSMALTYATSEGRRQFEWTDIVEAMTTVESGTAINQPTRAREAVDRHPRGRHAAPATSTPTTTSRPGSRSAAAAVRAPPPRSRRRERFVHWRSEGSRGSSGAGRNGGRDRLLRPELHRGGRRRRVATTQARSWSASPAWARAVDLSSASTTPSAPWRCRTRP
jgi:hypothetical protein